MDSIDALEFAIVSLNRKRTSRLDVAQQLEEAITTLRALRQTIADQQEQTAREQNIVSDWVERAGAPLREV